MVYNSRALKEVATRLSTHDKLLTCQYQTSQAIVGNARARARDRTRVLRGGGTSSTTTPQLPLYMTYKGFSSSYMVP